MNKINFQKIKGNIYISISFILCIVVIGAFIMFNKSNTNNNISTTKLMLPSSTGNISIEKTIKKRRSIREFKNIPLSSLEISQLLWSAQGITNKKENFRATPSAGALYPLEIYIVCGNVQNLETGVYKYNPKKHELNSIQKGDKRNELFNACLQQKSIQKAPASIVICAIYDKTTKKYGARGKQYVHMEVGAASENIYLQAISLDIGTVFIGGFENDKVQKTINSKKEEIPLCVMPLGKI
ncbi:SagB/ThcOx family dehydrogenase [Candidatus Babeliales bacterium]|nr:SagB/ThcOx family dehydrogenase [Candidatus Babeliales bacterium]